MDYPLREGVSGDAEATLLKLGDEEKVCNPALVNPHLNHSEVILWVEGQRKGPNFHLLRPRSRSLPPI